MNSLLSSRLQIYWADSGELCCIATDESFFILKYSAENVAKAQETPEVMTEDGIEDAFDVRIFNICTERYMHTVMLKHHDGQANEKY